MFSKSRKKIILSIMSSIIILFSLTLSVILFASFREIRQKNLDMLERYVEDYSVDNKEQNRNNKDFEFKKNPNKNSDYQLSTFYLVAISNNGSILSVDNGNISCRGKTKQINELEIELFSGSNDELKELGEYISNKFKISPENHSKFKQGLDLVDKNRV